MSGLKKSPLHRFSKHNTNPFDSDDELDNKQIRKSSGRMSKHNASNAKLSANASSRTNPFDSDDELDVRQTPKNSGSKSSKPSFISPDLSTNPFDNGGVKDALSPQTYHASTAKNRYKNDSRDLDDRQTPQNSRRKSSKPLFSSDVNTNPFDDHEVKDTSSSQTKNRYKNDFRDAGGLQSQTVEELENYAVYKAEETTNAVNNCLIIAEDMRESATKTMVTLHQQGEQLTRTHMVAADIDQDLSRGEKLLGSLGGMFSRTWKPKKTRPISGPVITRDDPIQRKGNHLEQRERLGLTSASKDERDTRTPPTEPTNALQKVEVEKLKQDDALSDLSNILGELKEMALDMGSEIDRQNKAMNHFQDDVEELNFRVKGANQRTRRLLGK